MKNAGLSSKVRKIQRVTTKRTAFANTQEIHFGVKEKQKSLRIQAEAIFQRQQKESALLTEAAHTPSAPSA